MSEEKVLLDALSQPAFKHSANEKNQTNEHETQAAEENKKQFGIDSNSTTADDKNEDPRSLISIVKAMSAEKQTQLVASLKQAGLTDPLTKESIVQNAFTVEKTIRDAASI